MLFRPHSELIDKHAFLSPSNYHWINYNDEKLAHRYAASRAAQRGTDLHALAHEAIRLGIRLDNVHESMATYVEDGIGFRMSCEQPLYYSENCFGTADTISYRRNKLRIHELKTGIIATSVHQLEVYAALFCLEYGIDPFEIEIELRIYQREEIRIFETPPETVAEIMDKIIFFDKQIEQIKASDDF